jgi:predicted RNase H-like nuclease (RuvC/YqgF family)
MKNTTMTTKKLSDIAPWDERNPFAKTDMAMAGIAMDQEINELRRALATSEQRIAELEKDAARYRWLRNIGETHSGDLDVCDEEGFSLSSDELDEAIDARLNAA